MLRVIARLNMGGPAQQVGILSGERMRALGYETLLVHGSLAPGEEALEEVAVREGAEMRFVREMGQPLRPTFDARALRRLTGAVRAFRPHIIHTHTAKAGLLGRLAALSGSPRPAIVHTYHGHVLRGYFGPVKQRVFLELEKRLASVSDALIGVSEATVDELVELGVAPRSRFRVVPLGLDLERFAKLSANPDPQARHVLGVDDDEVLFTFVGRLVPIKRVDLALRSLALARRKGVRVRLTVTGDGDARPELESLATSLGLTGVVDFLGYRSDLAAVSAASDAALLTSDNEGTPVSLIEAAAAGRPSVATDVGGVSDVVAPGTGMLAAAGDEGAIADAIARLASRPSERQQMGARARRRALERYSAGRLVADIDALYRELLDRAP